MNSVILTKSYKKLPFCEREILRYAGCKAADNETEMILKSVIAEVKDKLDYKVCYCELPLKTENDICDFGAFCVKSQNLAQSINGCEKIILFAATIGVGIDRIIAKYGRISPSKAIWFQAIGAAQIETLCNAFCEDIEKEYNICTRPRFSAGYGDLPLSVQREIFSILNPEKRIGLTLNDSLLMSPTKSVTAFVGLGDKVENLK